MEQEYKTISVTPRQAGSAVVECTNCQVRQTVELSEDGEPEFESVLCCEDSCYLRLCEHCPQFRCEKCEMACCAEHAVLFEGLQYCGVCAGEMKANREEETGDELRTAYEIGAERCPPRE